MPNKIVFMEALINYPQEPYFKGSIIKEYLLVVNPGAGVGQQVMDEKTRFSDQYGRSTAAHKAKPHITVANFLAKEEMEDTVLRWMHRIISSHKVFTVALNNYSGFPNANVIYIRVQDHQPFKQLAKELKVIDELVRSNGLPKAHLISNPHMTIARRLDKPVYEKAMMEYSRKDFHAEFAVEELILLKRTHQFDACKQVNVFRLLP
jgi:2'-5' RNA ligase